ncbi:MAG: hypothetical protein IPK74_21650 [Deltaproteobacteria bacterium]|nr:hypothetical protein [Deltaproteobacteria bacterium]
MDAGSRAAPDLFAALEWSARIAPPDVALPVATSSPAPAPSIAAPAETEAEAEAEIEIDATPSDLAPSPASSPAVVASPPTPPRATPMPPPRPTPMPPPRSTPMPPPGASRTHAPGKAPVPPPPPSLADLLEPDGPPADASPALDEFEGLLDLFDGDPAAEVAAASVPTPPASVPSATAKPVAPRGPRRPTPVIATMPKPGALPTASATVDFPAPGDPAVSAQLVAAELDLASPLVSRVSPVVPLPTRAEVPAAVAEAEPAPRRGRLPVLWIALTLLLGGALAWVVATQTDLLQGDVIAQRDAEAKAAEVADLEARKAEQERAKVEYGTIEIASTPKGARVFELREGPVARFEQLPVDHEYMVLVTAPGFAPRVRVVKGTELAAPVVMDLDAVPPGAAVPPIPEHDAPKLSRAPSKQTAALELRSNTAGATLGLLVGYTPGVKIVDVDVKAPHRFLLVLAEHEPTEVIVKGRHFEEKGGALEAFTEVTMGPAKPPIIMPAAPPTEAPADAEPALEAGAAPAGADDEAVVVEADEPPVAAPSKPVPKSKKKKKSRRSKRRR